MPGMSALPRACVCIGCVLLFHSAPVPLRAADTTTPNILMVLTDDMGYGDVTCNHPGIGVRTPNIDRLATEGIRFTQFYVASPICSPSRAAILTGRFPGRVGLTTFLHTRVHNTENQQADYLDPKVPTLPRILKSAGYATGHFGKWHVGGGRDVNDAPPIAAYGYDESVSTLESPSPDPKLGRYPIWAEKEKPEIPRHAQTAYIVDKAIDFMSRCKDRPFFVTLWPQDIHSPWRPSPEMITKFKGGEGKDADESIQNLRGVLEEYDRQMGRLMDSVTTMGLADTTVVIFTSDNGPFPKLAGRTGNLRGRKASLYEGGLREPFIVRWPNVAPAGAVNSTTVLTSVDLLPTLAAIAGARISREVGKELDGEDLSAAFRGESPSRSRQILWEFGRRPLSGSPANPQRPDISPNVAIRNGNWKLLVNRDGTRRELYDIRQDPTETNNVAVQHGDVADRLTSCALAWRESLPVVLRDETTSRTYVGSSGAATGNKSLPRPSSSLRAE